MNVPGFTAEASLRRTMGKYQGNAVFGSSGAIGVLPMQAFTAAHVEMQNLWRPPFGKKVWCCFNFLGLPRCTYTYVPIWYACDVLYSDGLPCMYCHPPVLQQ
jgi:hypothetical protein